MRLAASILASVVSLAACQRDPAPVTRSENVNIAVDTEGKITLNGKPVSEEELETFLAGRSGTIIVESDASGKATVTADGKRMTAEEFAAYKRGKTANE